MNTFVLLGLAVVLALFLMRSRRRRAGGDDTTPSPSRPLRGVGRRRREPADPPAAPAPSAPSSFGSPSPFAASTAPFAAVDTLPAPEPPRPAFAAAPGPTDWAPAEIVVEPGWPLPGEIAGTWTGGPQASPTPVATIETPAAHAETAATAHAASPESWQMPALAPVEPMSPAAHPVADDAPASAWTPGSADEVPAWPSEEAALPVWHPEPPAPAVSDGPSVVWTAAEDAPAADAADAPGIAPIAAEETVLPIWRPEEPVAAAPGAPAPAVDPPPAPAPVPDGNAPPHEAVAVTGPAAGITPTWDAPPPEPVDVTGPAAEITWDAPPPERVDVAEPASEPEPAPVWDAPPPEPVAIATPEPEPEPVWIAQATVPAEQPEPDAADLGAQSAEVAELVPSVLASLRPLVRVSDHVGITPRMLVVVRHLAATPLSVGELAALLGVSRPVVADIAARLESAGLTRRERDGSDRRRVRLVLTARGRRVHDESADAPSPEDVAGALAGMDAEDRDGLVRGLRALARSASA